VFVQLPLVPLTVAVVEGSTGIPDACVSLSKPRTKQVAKADHAPAFPIQCIFSLRFIQIAPYF
jgi:hypothetical protein